MSIYRDLMVDLETMGNGPDAAIVSIGAVFFNGDGAPGLGPSYYAVVDLQSAVDVGGRMDASTVLWWLQQSQEARDALTKPTGSAGLPLHTALKDLGALIRETAGDDAIVWGNGAGFDNVILTSAYQRLKMPMPWKFFNNRCFRTLKNLRRDIKGEQIGVKHNALADAVSQAQHAIAILAAMRGAGTSSTTA